VLLASLSDNICETIKEASSEKTRLELFFAVFMANVVALQTPLFASVLNALVS